MRAFIFILIGLAGIFSAISLELVFLGCGINCLTNGDYLCAAFSFFYVLGLIKIMSYIVNDYHGE